MISTHIEILLRHIQAYLVLFVTLAYSQPIHILSPGIFRTRGPEVYLKPCETLTRHIQNPAIGHHSAILWNIQNHMQRLHMQKPDIIGILEYSEPFDNDILTYIQNPAIFTKIYEYSEL